MSINNKILLFADPHLGIKNGSELWHNTTIELFKTIADECEKRSINTIICLGDWFHNRRALSVKTIAAAVHISDILEKFTTYIILGNHDTFYKFLLDPSSLDVYSQHKNIILIKEPYALGDIMMLPWGDYREIGKYSQYKYIFGHFEINGFPMTKNYILSDANRLNSDNFKGVENVISGHFHCPSHKGNIRYLGAPYQMTFIDSGGDRGYYIFEDGKIEFINYTKAPKFIKINTEEEFTKEKISGNFIKLKYIKDYGKSENDILIEKVQAFNPLTLSADFSNISEEKSNDIIEDVSIKSSKEIFFEYIDRISNIPENLNKKTIKNIFNQLIEGE